MPVAVQIKELLKGSETYVAAVLQAAKLFEPDIESLPLVKAEAGRWTLYVPVFQTIKETQTHASTSMFPILAILLKTLLTLPISNAEAVVFLSIKKAENLFEEYRWSRAHECTCPPLCPQYPQFNRGNDQLIR